VTKKMRQHQFESYEVAKAYLEERGTLTYWGWEGQMDGYYVYTFVAKNGIKYHCDVFKDGLVRVRPF
jgi:hypothetical protein